MKSMNNPPGGRRYVVGHIKRLFWKSIGFIKQIYDVEALESHVWNLINMVL